MTKLLVFSDTHGFLDPQIFPFAQEADIIIHAGDIGNMDWPFSDKTIFKVWGNVDDVITQKTIPEIEIFKIEDLNFLLIHILKKGKKIKPEILNLITEHQIDVVIHGHTHQPEFTRTDNLLVINPGAAGKQGFHKKRTMLIFTIEGKTFLKREVIELNPR